jgi:predicted nucleotidyltransferase
MYRMVGHMESLTVQGLNIGWEATPLLIGRRGSHAHGTYLPPSVPTSIDDEDWFCVAYHFPAWYVGLQGYRNKEEQKTVMEGRLDTVVYDIQKFFYLLLKGNPNVHAWLWAEREDYSHISEVWGERLLVDRGKFLSKQVLKHTGGYARGQIHRMTHIGDYHGDMGEKRKRLVDKFGYDVKNASHCIRLLWMGKELANSGLLHVRLPNDIAKLCIEIKTGMYSLTDIKLMTNRMWDEFVAAEAATQLPDEPDREWANQLLTRIILEGE